MPNLTNDCNYITYIGQTINYKQWLNYKTPTNSLLAIPHLMTSDHDYVHQVIKQARTSKHSIQVK